MFVFFPKVTFFKFVPPKKTITFEQLTMDIIIDGKTTTYGRQNAVDKLSFAAHKREFFFPPFLLNLINTIDDLLRLLFYNFIRSKIIKN